MLFFKITNLKIQEQKVIIKGINGKKLLNLFGKKLNPNQQKREEKVEKEKEKENDKKTHNLPQVAPIHKLKYPAVV